MTFEFALVRPSGRCLERTVATEKTSIRRSKRSCDRQLGCQNKATVLPSAVFFIFRLYHERANPLISQSDSNLSFPPPLESAILTGRKPPLDSRKHAFSVEFR